MLLNLPTEVVLYVSSLLEFRDKLSLNATCKKLNDLISKTNLYECIDMTKYEAGTKNIMKEFETNPIKGAQVKNLYMDLCEFSQGSIGRLDTIFPNVTRFGTPYCLAEEDIYKQRRLRRPLSKWRNTLEIFISTADWIPIWYTLQRFTFPRLTVLEITKYRYMNVDLGKLDGLSFLQCIKNAPSLQNLTLEDCGLNLDFFEELHDVSPSIKSLSLKRIMLTIDNYELPKKIVPANSVLRLEMKCATFFDTKGLLPEYIVKKYTHLQHLWFTPERSEYRFQEELSVNYYPGSFKYYKNSAYVDDGVDTGITKKEYDALFLDYQSTLRIHKSIEPNFFSKVPKTIKSLTVDIKTFINIKKVLVESDMKLMKLNVVKPIAITITTLEQQKLLLDVNHLTSLKTMGISLCPEIQKSKHKNVISTSITNLTIEITGRIFIDWLLSSFPSLTYLCVTGNQHEVVHVGTDSHSHPQKTYPNLRKLKIKDVRFEQGSLDSIKVIAPNVKELDLSAGISVSAIKEHMEYHLDLSGWNLEKCSLYVYGGVRPNQIKHCKITIENTTRRFSFVGLGNTVEFPFKCDDPKRKKEYSYVKVKCDNVKELKLCEYQIKIVDGDIMIAG